VVVDEAGERAGLVVDKVCIDAGHGGREHGKESANGVFEKDVTLAIARVVRDRIQADLRLEVVMTRDDDRLLGLRERTEIANASGSDLFVSIHCNSWFNQHTGGFESYFLSPARSESDRALAHGTRPRRWWTRRRRRRVHPVGSGRTSTSRRAHVRGAFSARCVAPAGAAAA
jgi:N-acetylmuramoyl-L-alanine amidase